MLISHEELFVNTVQDLRCKIRTNSTYSIIRACGLCRHLILDSPSLLHQANKEHKLKITFHIKDYTNTPLSHDYVGSGGRTILPIGESVKVKIDQFLSAKIHHYGKNEVTVKDFIHTAAHYYGGIHSGVPDEKQKFLSKLNAFYKKETNISYWHMKAICMVILNAIKPLEQQIKKASLREGFNHSIKQS